MTARSLLRSPLFGAVVIILAWWVLVPLLRVPAFYLPPLGVVMHDAALAGPTLATGFAHTLLETVLGFALGAALGMTFGVTFAYASLLERTLFPLIVASQTVPVIAFGAVLVIWFGNGLLSKVMIALFLAFFPVTMNTLRGVQACDPERIALLRSFGAGRWSCFVKLALPSAMPTIMVGLKLGVSLSLAGAIVGEWFGDTRGLGTMLLQSLYFNDTARVWVVVIACGVMGALLYGVLVAVERRFVWWKAA